MLLSNVYTHIQDLQCFREHKILTFFFYLKISIEITSVLHDYGLSPTPQNNLEINV